MRNSVKTILTGIFIFAAAHCAAQKTLKETWQGGHGCVALTLNLYSDSSYTFISESALVFTMRSTRRGHYLLTPSQITLFEKKKLAFLFFSQKHKYNELQYRVAGNKILLYSQEDEHSKDSSFIMAYNTLSK